MTIRPLQDRIVVRRVAKTEETPGGIIIPTSARERPQQGTVVAVGDGKPTQAGRVPLTVKVGDQVLFGKYAGNEVKVAGEELVILRESDLLGVLGDDSPAFRPRVYVAGPISIGDVDANIRQGIEAGLRLLDLGYAPFIPHFSHTVDSTAVAGTERYETWLANDFSWIRACQAVLRLPGESAGADREVALARSFGIPVFETIEALQEGVPANAPR